MDADITLKELQRLKEIERKQKERYKKQNEYTNQLYDRISFTVPKGKKKIIEDIAKSNGLTVNKFISEIVLITVDNKNIAQMIFNNNLEKQKQESVQTTQKGEISHEAETVKESTEEPPKAENEANKKLTVEEVQAMLEAKRAEKDRLKAEKEAKEAREKQQETEELINGILEIKNDREEAKKQEIEEDKKKFEQFEESEIKAVLKDDSAFRKYFSSPICKYNVVKECGIANYERIQKCLKELEAEENEAKRQETIEKANDWCN